MKLIHLFCFFALHAFCHAAIKAPLSPSFDKLAQLNFKESPKAYTTPLDNYYEALRLIIKAYLYENNTYYQEAIGHSQQFIETLSGSQYDNDIKHAILIKLAFLYIDYGNYWDAFWALKKVANYTQKTDKPTTCLQFQTLGTYNIAIGSIPGQYHWLLGLFQISGSLGTGIGYLNSGLSCNDDYSIETKVINELISTIFLKEKPTHSTIGQFAQTSDYALFQFLDIYTKFKTQQSEEALYILEKPYFASSNTRFYLFDFIQAEIYFQKQEYHRAKKLYSTFVKNTISKKYLSHSYYKLYLIELLDGQGNANKSYYHEKALAWGSTQIELDKHAMKQFEQKDNINLQLLQLRYAIDGGFDTLASKILENKCNIILSTKPDSIELSYRCARLAHLQNNWQEAEKLYKLCIKEQKSLPLYFAPNSYLQLAHIYYKFNKFPKANYCLGKIKQFNSYPLKAGIEHEAHLLSEMIKNQAIMPKNSPKQ